LSAAIKQKVIATLAVTTWPVGSSGANVDASSLTVTCGRVTPLGRRSGSGSRNNARALQQATSPNDEVPCEPSSGDPTCILTSYNMTFIVSDTTSGSSASNGGTQQQQDPVMWMTQQALNDPMALLAAAQQELSSPSSSLPASSRTAALSSIQGQDGSLSASLAVTEPPAAVAVVGGPPVNPPAGSSNDSDNGGLGVGAIAGIAAAAAVVLAVAGAAAYLRWNKLKSSINPPPRGSMKKGKAGGSIVPRSASLGEAVPPSSPNGSSRDNAATSESSAFIVKNSKGKITPARKTSVAAAMAANGSSGSGNGSKKDVAADLRVNSGSVPTMFNPTFSRLHHPTAASTAQAQRQQRTQRALGSVVAAFPPSSASAAGNGGTASTIPVVVNPVFKA
jgi:hypothetical protein